MHEPNWQNIPIETEISKKLKEQFRKTFLYGGPMDWKAEDLKCMKSSSDWPLYPLLPMKLYDQNKRSGWPTYGVMLAWDKKPIVYVNARIHELGAAQHLVPSASGAGFTAVELKGEMPLENIPGLRERLEKYDKQEFPTFEALQEAGWAID